MTLVELSDHVGVPLLAGDPRAAPNPLGENESRVSPRAQACASGVVAIDFTEDCAYSIVHEMAHIVMGFDADHDQVFEMQGYLAGMLDEPMRTRALGE